MTKDEIQKVRTLLCDAIITPELWDMRDEVFAILDRALAAPEPEPVAWQERRAIYRKGGVKWSEWYPCDYTSKQVAAARESTPSDEYEWRPLFATPPSREWQSLTDEEIEHTINNIRTCEWQGAFNQALARAIEAALRTKNTGERG